MALHTSNIYGNISVSDEAVALVIKKVAMDCYGVSELVSRRLSDSVLMLFNKDPIGRGIKLVTVDNRIYIDIYCLPCSLWFRSLPLLRSSQMTRSISTALGFKCSLRLLIP